jgi:hypothetical protein
MRSELLQSAETSNGSKVQYYVALGSLIWWVIVWSVCGIGFTQLYVHLLQATSCLPRNISDTQTDSATIGDDPSQQHVLP